MPSPLKHYIEKRLKENVPLAEIKKDLQEKGYDTETVKKAVREAIAGVDKKLSPVTIFQLSVLVIGIVIAISVGFYLTSNKTSETTQTSSPFCGKFEELDYKISCNKAIELALLNAAGDVQDVSIGPVRTTDPSTDPPSIIFKDMWLVDIRSENPYFDQDFERDVQIMRIGIGLNEHYELYKQVLG